MTRFFALISYDGPNRNEFYFENQLDTHLLSIGWGIENPFDFESVEELTQMISRYAEENETLHNANNGGESMHLFKSLAEGDIVFVRGDAQIVDVVRITGDVFYDPNPERPHYRRYNTFAPFQQLRPGEQIFYPLREMPRQVHDTIIFEDARYRVFKELEKDIAIELLLNIITRI